MLSIFEPKEFERQPEKKLTLNRLQNVLSAKPTAVAEQPPAAAAAEPSLPVTAAAAPPAYERKAVAPAPEPVVRTAPPPAEPPGPPMAPELTEFAAQFSRGLREVLASAVRDIQAPMAEERRKMDEVFDLHSRTARDVEGLRSEVHGAYERIDSLTKLLQELAAKAGRAEDAVNLSTSVAHAIQEAQQAFEKRLELQAGVIRSLHSAMQARQERLDRVLSAFQSLQGSGGERPPRRALPEDL